MAFSIIGLGTDKNDGTGDDLRTAGGKINNNFKEAINNQVLTLLADEIRPAAATSAYYLESDTFPALVFSDTVTESAKARIHEFVVPASAVKLTVKLQAFHTDSEAPADRDVCWKLEAGWIYDERASVVLGTAVYLIQTLESDDGKLKWSAASGEITPDGIREASAELRLKITRDIAYEPLEVVQDTLASEAFLYKIEISWV
jgi:hypothetical protein